MKRCIARYSEAFDILLSEIDKMKTRIEALEKRDFHHGSDGRDINSNFGNIDINKPYLRMVQNSK